MLQRRHRLPQVHRSNLKVPPFIPSFLVPLFIFFSFHFSSRTPAESPGMVVFPKKKLYRSAAGGMFNPPLDFHMFAGAQKWEGARRRSQPLKGGVVINRAGFIVTNEWVKCGVHQQR